ncbi:glycosyltransferase [Gillisia sp. Hel_I_29]|uniref:glycosyltransferase n=1 Tax=Gillisia sp. Hel_I_29 TaxID=1249975 RepID=UPI000556F7E9|nr:glycosyltransferase [Gillisia sp. Hel_I_29]
MNFKEFKMLFQKIEVEHYANNVPENVVVSVLVQTFNHGSYISECLDSILMQKTNFNYEILIGEDNSNDLTREICIDYAKRFPEKIKLFLHHPKNKIFILDGPTGNFNAFYNLFSANGAFIAFCEGDDKWTDPNKLQDSVDFLNLHKDYSFAYHSFETIDAINLPKSSEEEKNQPLVDINSIKLKRCAYHPLLLTTCFRNHFQDIPAEIVNVINIDSFMISLLGNYGNAKFLKKIKPSQYRKHDGGIWSLQLREKQIRSKILTYKNISNYYNNKEKLIADYFKERTTNSYKTLIYHQLKEGSLLQITTTIWNILKLKFN